MSEYGIRVAIRDYLQGLTALHAGTRFVHDLGKDQPLPRREMDLAFFRIVQEAVTNALRHGKASEVRVTLDQDEERVSLSIYDDGSGFDDALGSTRGIGLRSMRERMALLGGSLNVESRDGETRVHAELTIDHTVTLAP